MKKIAIFNVGGASAAYVEINNHKLIMDLGRSKEFDPVLNFLLPLAQKRGFEKSLQQPKKFVISQAFLSHLDNDHIAAIHEFDEYFHPQYLTAPCDHPKQNTLFNIIRNFFDSENRNVTKVLDLMSEVGGRAPGHGTGSQEDIDQPLVINRFLSQEEDIELHHIPAGICEKDEVLKEHYANNMSLVILLNIDGYNILFTGDIMDVGMQYLIENRPTFKERITKEGVDFLVVPHHGLTTSFPGSLFNTIKNNKVKLNIISEKKAVKEETENRSDVDSRYSDPEFSEGHKIINGLKDFQHSIMTSNSLKTHILIDFDSEQPIVKRCTTEDLLLEFLKT